MLKLLWRLAPSLVVLQLFASSAAAQTPAPTFTADRFGRYANQTLSLTPPSSEGAASPYDYYGVVRLTYTAGPYAAPQQPNDVGQKLLDFIKSWMDQRRSSAVAILYIDLLRNGQDIPLSAVPLYQLLKDDTGQSTYRYDTLVQNFKEKTITPEFALRRDDQVQLKLVILYSSTTNANFAGAVSSFAADTAAAFGPGASIVSAISSPALSAQLNKAQASLERQLDVSDRETDIWTLGYEDSAFNDVIYQLSDSTGRANFGSFEAKLEYSCSILIACGGHYKSAENMSFSTISIAGLNQSAPLTTPVPRAPQELSTQNISASDSAETSCESFMDSLHGSYLGLVESDADVIAYLALKNSPARENTVFRQTACFNGLEKKWATLNMDPLLSQSLTPRNLDQDEMNDALKQMREDSVDTDSDNWSKDFSSHFGGGERITLDVQNDVLYSGTFRSKSATADDIATQLNHIGIKRFGCQTDLTDRTNPADQIVYKMRTFGTLSNPMDNRVLYFEFTFDSRGVQAASDPPISGVVIRVATQRDITLSQSADGKACANWVVFDAATQNVSPFSSPPAATPSGAIVNSAPAAQVTPVAGAK